MCVCVMCVCVYVCDVGVCVYVCVMWVCVCVWSGRRRRVGRKKRSETGGEGFNMCVYIICISLEVDIQAYNHTSVKHTYNVQTKTLKLQK